MSRYLKTGARVFREARKMPKGKGMSYEAASGMLLEDARVGPDAGWDVVDLQLDSGEIESAYSFDLKPLSSRRNSPGQRPRRWIQQALGVRRRRLGYGPHHKKSLRIEGAKKGALRRQLRTPKGEKIPMATLRKAAKKKGVLSRRARLALTLRKFSKKRKARKTTKRVRKTSRKG